MPKYDNFDLDLQVSNTMYDESSNMYGRYNERTVSIHVTDTNIMICCLD